MRGHYFVLQANHDFFKEKSTTPKNESVGRPGHQYDIRNAGNRSSPLLSPTTEAGLPHCFHAFPSFLPQRPDKSSGGF